MQMRSVHNNHHKTVFTEILHICITESTLYIDDFNINLQHKRHKHTTLPPHLSRFDSLNQGL